METGYYWIKKDGQALPARWDGEKWHSEKGSHGHENDDDVIGPIGFSCPTGCTCTQNSDGSWSTHCN